MKEIKINPVREKTRCLKITLPTLLNPIDSVDKIAKSKLEHDIRIPIEQEIYFKENDNSLFSYLYCVSEIEKQLKQHMGNSYKLAVNIEIQDQIIDLTKDDMKISYPSEIEGINALTEKQLFINKDIKNQIKNQLHISNLDPDEYQILLDKYQKYDVFIYIKNDVPVNIHIKDIVYKIVYRKSLNLTAVYYALIADQNNLEYGFDVRWDDNKINTNTEYGVMLINIYGGYKTNECF